MTSVLKVRGVRRALRDFTLELDFECEDWPLVVLGPSGAGKTCLLRLVAGLDRPDQGRIEFSGEEWCDTTRKAWVPSRERSLGMCFQAPTLFPHKTVLENVAFAEATSDRALEVLERFGVSHLRHSYPGRISGGEQGRVALARALARDPNLLLLDEPFAHLDPSTRDQLFADVWPVLRDLRRPTIWVTHDHVMAQRLGGRTLVLIKGGIRFGPEDGSSLFWHDGSPHEGICQQTPAVARFLNRHELR